MHVYLWPAAMSPSRPPRKSSPTSARRRNRRARNPWRRLLVSLLAWGLVALAVAGLALAVAVAFAMRSLPHYSELKKSPQGQSVVIRAADGTELVTVGPSYGRWLTYAEIPDTMVEAMKAVEDRRFDRHIGIDPIGMLRALKVNFQSGVRLQGASTITQQLARNLFLTRTRTYDRKIREVVVALAMERSYSKQQIMEAYLNRVYFGGGAYGIDAASRKFYGHPATKLDLEQAAIIAGLVKAPSRYAPTADPERARGRAKIVIHTMRKSGAISAEQEAAADIDAVRFVVDRRQGDVRYYTDWVLSQLDMLSDETDEALDVTTSLNPRHQAAAEEAAKAQNIGGTQIAILAMRTDGAVTAMVGGREYATSIYNRAVTAQRQPGSAWKLFDYLVALEDGKTPDTMVVDEPLRIGNWSPRNANGRHVGPVSLRQAFAQSINTVAVRLGQQHGFENVAQMARRFGITTPISTQPAMALGTSDVTLMEMTAAYASIASGGIEARPWAIQSITTASGRMIYNRQPESPRILVAPFVARYMTSMLRSVVESGTGRQARFGRELAGKTGTTSSGRDGWFIGFTPDLTAGVWIGRDDARPVAGLAGGQAPARAFAAFMSRALEGVTATPLDDEVHTPGADDAEPDDEAYGLSLGGGLFSDDVLQGQIDPGRLDPNLDPGAAGPVAPQTPTPQPSGTAAPAPLTDAWLEDVIQSYPGT